MTKLTSLARALVFATLIAAAAGALVTWWLLPNSGPAVVSAQDILKGTCDESETSDYDVAYTGTLVSKFPDNPDYPSRNIEATVEVSGRDYRISVDTTGLPYTHEAVKVGDETFWRNSEDDKWRLSETSINSYLSYLPYSVCTELGAVAKVSEETVGSIEVDRYQFTATQQGSGAVFTVDDQELVDDERDLVHDLWVDDDGQLVKFQSVQDFSTGVSTYVIMISGVGEPNIITRPATSTIVANGQ